MSNLNPTEPGLALIQEIQRKDCDVQWMTSVLFMLDKDHVFFNEHYSGRGKYRMNNPENAQDDERFDIYKTVFDGMPIPKGRKRPNVANQLLRGD